MKLLIGADEGRHKITLNIPVLRDELFTKKHVSQQNTAQKHSSTMLARHKTWLMFVWRFSTTATTRSSAMLPLLPHLFHFVYSHRCNHCALSLVCRCTTPPLFFNPKLVNNPPFRYYIHAYVAPCMSITIKKKCFPQPPLRNKMTSAIYYNI